MRLINELKPMNARGIKVTEEEYPRFEEAKPLTCDRCGGQLAKYGTYCPYCGTRIWTRLYELKIEDHLVHCKDCKYYNPYICLQWSKYGTITTEQEGYCYKAERITDGR